MAEMRLAYLVSQYPATSHTFISREVNALRELGVQVETLSIKPAPPAELQGRMWKEEAAHTYVVRRENLARFLEAQIGALFGGPKRYFSTLSLAMRHRVPGARGLGMAFVYFAEAVVLSRELRRRRITRLHNHFANPGAIAGLLASRLAGIPWSFTMHGISETDYPAGLLLGEKIKTAEFVACVSYFGRAQAMRLVPADQWDKLEIVRCGLPIATLPARDSSSGCQRLICVGRLSPEKGQAGLLRALAIIRTEMPDLTLKFIGEGPDRRQLESLAKSLGVAASVTFAGRLSEQDTLEQIAASDMLILPSFMEGLPIVLMEAMALGVPVIASRVAGIPELVDEGRTGLLFTPSNWSELADRILELASRPEMQRQFAEAGPSIIRAEFDAMKSATRMLELFSQGARN